MERKPEKRSQIGWEGLGLFPSGFPTKTLHASLFSTMYATYPAHRIPRRHNIIITLSRRTNSVSLISDVTLTAVASSSTSVQSRRISLRSHRKRLEISQAKRCKTTPHPLRESPSGPYKDARCSYHGFLLL
jgi:hypothetical protein